MQAIIRIYKRRLKTDALHDFVVVTALPLDWIKKFEGLPATNVCGVRLHPYWGSQQNGTYRMHISDPHDSYTKAEQGKRMIVKDIAFAKSILMEWSNSEEYTETKIEL